MKDIEKQEVLHFHFTYDKICAQNKNKNMSLKTIHKRNITNMLNWKIIPKIDAHIHLMPPDIIEANKNCGDKWVDFGSVDDYLKLMDKYHIESAFIMPFNDPYMLSMDFTVTSVHRNLSAMCSQSNDKLSCFADIDLQNDITDTLHELENVFQKKEFIGIKIHPSNTGYPVDGTYYDQIFDWACRHNILVEIHSYPRVHISDDVCSPSRIRNVCEKYPTLRISVAHLGGFQYEELRGLDVYLNLSAILPDLVQKYGIEKANQILRTFNLDKLIFATDYPDSRCLNPEEIYDTYFELLGKMDFTQEEAEKICKYNALSMLTGKSL